MNTHGLGYYDCKRLRGNMKLRTLGNLALVASIVLLVVGLLVLFAG